MRIDNLTPDTPVKVSIGTKAIDAVFLGIRDTGYDRIALFGSREESDGELYRWTAYRHKGRWVTGVKAEIVKLLWSKME